MNDGRTARTAESPWRLLRATAGSPADLAEKVRRLRVALRGYADRERLDRRLARLVARGYVDEAKIPTRIQLAVGAIDMLRFWISPAAAQYYADKGISYGFHQVLRVLDDPASMIDPIGLLSDRDVIIGHLMQVVHANPHYDLQLLEAHDDGLEELERQIAALIAGTHPRARSIGAIVEDPGYHERLLAYAKSYRADRAARAPIRENVAADARWGPIERTFGTLPCAMDYFAKMPTSVGGAIAHLRNVKTFPEDLAAPPARSPAR
ncbi:MAG: hypothetical protein KF819_38555 [Labilithrix sp.]|nr:hypothetical protein [Labilithrix sp.]